MAYSHDPVTFSIPCKLSIVIIHGWLVHIDNVLLYELWMLVTKALNFEASLNYVNVQTNMCVATHMLYSSDHISMWLHCHTYDNIDVLTVVAWLA